MAAPRRRSPRDRRRRSHGQNLLVDDRVVDRLLGRLDLREVALPRQPYRVVASPPYALTTRLLAPLLDDPRTGPQRADLLLQWEVARKRAGQPPSTLRSAAWAPWWRFDLGDGVPRDAFRPVPATDSAWLTVTRRDPPVLPTHLAPAFRDALAPHWPS